MPIQWKEYKVCFISKGVGKGYRPISMSNTFLKLLERIVNYRLQWWMENNNYIPRNFLDLGVINLVMIALAFLE